MRVEQLRKLIERADDSVEVLISTGLETTETTSSAVLFHDTGQLVITPQSVADDIVADLELWQDPEAD